MPCLGHIDAEAAARKVLSGEATPAAKDTTGIVEAIRQLSVARNSAIKAREAAVRIGDHQAHAAEAPVAQRAQELLPELLAFARRGSSPTAAPWQYQKGSSVCPPR